MADNGPSEAAQVQAAITQQKQLLSTLREAEGSADEISAGEEVLRELEERLATLLAALTGGSGDGEGKKKKKKGKGSKIDKAARQQKTKSDAELAKGNKKKVSEHRIDYEEITPVGEKKDLSREMLPQYFPVAVESAWYEWWEQEGFFHADAEAAKNKEGGDPFVIVIPPPNVTGSLHLGHALTNSVQDALTRWHRMQGKVALWVPGTDHAGIATQVVVEKKIMREEGRTRHDYGREAFLEKVWEWKEASGSRISHQLRRLGSSLDWEREVFTMDDKCNKAVREAFVRMYDAGKIYRSTRLINWSCTLKTAISDIEVDYETIDGPRKFSVPGHERKVQFGVITSFAYKIADGDNPEDEIVVATTRLETMLGDTAVAIHPQDPRYTHLHGKHVRHPFVPDRVIPIVLDAELVDMSFGTGAVKVTPAHDPNDYRTGKKHDLEFISIFTEDGRINEEGGEAYAGMMRFDARWQIEQDLRELDLYRGVEPNPMRLGFCSRSKDVIEPMLKPQWFVDCGDMAARAVDAVRSGDLRLIPDNHNHTWFHWLENIQDWCISRQLWWGHRVPAYYVTVDGLHEADEFMKDDERWVAGRDEAEAIANACTKFGVEASAVTVDQDPDVLDTWFSSGLFPFSVMGWPDQTPEMEAFFPGSLLETGSDILFFWVARMVMMSLELCDTLPFTDVYLHAMVRDAHGRKMSKSLGNVVDPLDMITGTSLDALNDKLRNSNLAEAEVARAIKGQKADFPHGIPECGADAMRFGLCAYTSQGRDINLDINRVVGYRNFCNKLWNTARFFLSQLPEGWTPADTETDLHPASSDIDKWILHYSSTMLQEVHQGLVDYDFAASTTAVYSYFLNFICDYYLELIKGVSRGDDADAAEAARQTLYTVVERGLRSLHPYMPFITEELWQRLPRRASDTAPSIMLASFPGQVEAWEDETLVAEFEEAKEVIHAIRSVRGQYKLTPRDTAKITIITGSDTATAVCTRFAQAVIDLCHADGLDIEQDGEMPSGTGVSVVNPDIRIGVNLRGVIDVEKEVKKLEKKLGQLGKRRTKLEAKMTNPKYLENVPDNVKEKDTKTLEDTVAEMEVVEAAITDFREQFA